MTHAALDFEEELDATENRAMDIAERLLKQFFGLNIYPHKDSTGRATIGWGRRFNDRPMSEATADHYLRDEMMQNRQKLRVRVFALMAKNPIPDYKLAALYAIADIIDVERVREWAALWEALESGAWARAVRELMRCDIDRLFGTSEQAKDTFVDLIMILISDKAPT